jgi:CRP-like cAMP-binding protein
VTITRPPAVQASLISSAIANAVTTTRLLLEAQERVQEASERRTAALVACRDLGITQAEIAEALGYTQKTISTILRKVRP